MHVSFSNMREKNMGFNKGVGVFLFSFWLPVWKSDFWLKLKNVVHPQSRRVLSEIIMEELDVAMEIIYGPEGQYTQGEEAELSRVRC